MHVDLVKKFEGLRLEAYYDQAGVITIGYGHTGPDVVPGMKITQARAEELLDADLDWAERTVRDAVKVKLDDEHFAALVSLTFNIGADAFRGSTLLRKLNAGDYLGAANEFPKWRNVTNRETGAKTVSEGLVKRREMERTLFLTGDVPDVAIEPGEMTSADATGGEHKPLRESKTVNTALIGTVLSGLSSVAAAVNGMDWKVAAVFVVVGGLFAYLAFNRFLEWRSGEH